jgi:hypothetical protein
MTAMIQGAVPPLDINVVPAELRNRQQWLVWRFEPNKKKPEGKLLKVPYYANGNRRHGGQGDEKDRAQLVTLDVAMLALAAPRTKAFTGIGFAFLPDDGLIGVDIDKCIDRETGEISALAQEIITGCHSYTEYSPSRTGVHIIVTGQTKTFKSDAVGVEVFCSSQYFTFTTQSYLSDVPTSLTPISDEMLARLRVIVKGDVAETSHQALPPRPLVDGNNDLARLESALIYVSPEGYDQWVKVGMAIYNSLGDGGFRLWDYWSAKSGKYSGTEECQSKWKSFGGRDIQITIATVFKWAIDGGWKAPRSLMATPVKARPSSPTPSIEDTASPSPPLPLVEERTDLSSAAQEPREEEIGLAAVETAEIEVAEERDAPDLATAAQSLIDATTNDEVVGFLPLQWALDHCALVRGTTDVWDSLNRLRFKKSAFVGMVGKDTAKAWESHAERKMITLAVSAEEGAESSGEGGGGDDKKKKTKKVYGDDFWDKVERLNDSFALIYGLDEVWDGEARRLLKINPLRLAFGNDAIKFWLNNPERKLIPMDKVVFDPTMKSDPETTVNLFNGFGMEPKAGEYNLILELLFHLCGEDSEVFSWVLCWLAYPLQNPGAKMATSIIMHGDEGSGKNLFFEKCIAQIYGEYGGIIGNAEIESQFNEWASKKLFVVCDEVVTKSELRQLKGRLKAMVSNPTININPKNLAGRSEANHMNFGFLSNELQPLALDKTDRRYMVIWTPEKQSEAYYAEVAKQMFSGGNEAFYHFLLNFDVGTFNEHTKPLMTKAKQDLIDLGLSPPERFYREWAEGLLPLPFVCCASMQLYAAFCRWSYLNGERFPATQTMFGRTIKRIGFGNISTCAVKYDLLSDVRQRTVYLVGDQPQDKTREKWVEDASNIFEKNLQKYRHVFDHVDSKPST